MGNVATDRACRLLEILDCQTPLLEHKPEAPAPAIEPELIKRSRA